MGRCPRGNWSRLSRTCGRRQATTQFWFVVQGKSDPSETDTNLMKWLASNQIWFEVVTGDADSMDEIYTDAQEVYTVKRLGQKVVNLLNTKPEENESADVLGSVRLRRSGCRGGPLAEQHHRGGDEGGLQGVRPQRRPGRDRSRRRRSSSRNTTGRRGRGRGAAPTPTKRASKKAAASPNGAKSASTTYSRDDLEEHGTGSVEGDRRIQGNRTAAAHTDGDVHQRDPRRAQGGRRRRPWRSPTRL